MLDLNRRAPERIRTSNLLIRSQMLYPLSYGRFDNSERSLAISVCWSEMNPGAAADPRANPTFDELSDTTTGIAELAQGNAAMALARADRYGIAATRRPSQVYPKTLTQTFCTAARRSEYDP